MVGKKNFVNYSEICRENKAVFGVRSILWHRRRSKLQWPGSQKPFINAMTDLQEL